MSGLRRRGGGNAAAPGRLRYTAVLMVTAAENTPIGSTDNENYKTVMFPVVLTSGMFASKFCL
jgi:hypothetical protein